MVSKLQIECFYDNLQQRVNNNNIPLHQAQISPFIDNTTKPKLSLNKLLRLSGCNIKITNKGKSIIHYSFGYKEINQDKIFISKTKFNGSKFNNSELIIVTLHELTHGLIHRSPKKQYENFFRDEIEAQSVAYIVAKYFNINDVISQSLISYAQHKEYERLNKNIPIRKNIILKTSSKIINCLNSDKIIYQDFFKNYFKN